MVALGSAKDGGVYIFYTPNYRFISLDYKGEQGDSSGLNLSILLVME